MADGDWALYDAGGLSVLVQKCKPPGWCERCRHMIWVGAAACNCRLTLKCVPNIVEDGTTWEEGKIADWVLQAREI